MKTTRGNPARGVCSGARASCASAGGRHEGHRGGALLVILLIASGCYQRADPMFFLQARPYNSNRAWPVVIVAYNESTTGRYDMAVAFEWSDPGQTQPLSSDQAAGDLEFTVGDCLFTNRPTMHGNDRFRWAETTDRDCTAPPLMKLFEFEARHRSIPMTCSLHVRNFPGESMDPRTYYCSWPDGGELSG